MNITVIQRASKGSPERTVWRILPVWSSPVQPEVRGVAYESTTQAAEVLQKLHEPHKYTIVGKRLAATPGSRGVATARLSEEDVYNILRGLEGAIGLSHIRELLQDALNAMKEEE